MKKILESKMRVQYHDCDPYNHLNNSRYIDYLIAARTEQLIENYGFDSANLAQTKGIAWVIAQNQISYLSSATWSEIVSIETRLISFSDSSLEIEAVMWDEDHTHIKAIMWSLLVHFDIKTQKPIKHNEEFKTLFSKIILPIEPPLNFVERVSIFKKQFYLKKKNMKIDEFKLKLDTTKNELIDLIKSVSDEQAFFKKDENWSIIEILEHIIITEKTIHSIISRPSEDTRASSEIIGKIKIEHILIVQRNQKIITLENLKPTGKTKSLYSFENDFLAEREQLKNDLQSGQIIIDNRIHKHPHLGEMTIADWLYFSIYHTQRHTEQIKERLQNSKI